MELISFACALLLFYQIQGASSATPVFLQTGKTLSLVVKEHFVLGKGGDFKWTFNYSENIVKLFDKKPIIFDKYEGRAELFVQNNHTLLLMNVHKNDSGLYTAHVSGNKEQLVAVYKVTVQDPVSPVELNVDSVFNRSHSCNLTVTCSTQDSHLSSTFRCDTKTCSQEGGKRSEVTTSGASVHIYLLNDLIICNHSNQVSWTKNMLNIQHSCPRGADPESVRHHAIVPVSTLSGLAILGVAAVAVFYRKRRRHESVNIDNTVYADPQTARPLDPTNDAPGGAPISIYSVVTPHTGPKGPTETGGDALSEGLHAQTAQPTDPTNAPGVSPTSIYSVVTPHTGPKGSIETGGNTQPESLYAQIEKTSRS